MLVVGEIEKKHDLVAQFADVDTVVGASVRNRLECLEIRARRLVGLGQRFARNDMEKGVEKKEEAGSSGVDNTGLLENRQQVGRPRQ